ncbi:MAG TPA: CinA family protein [Streptosporangiaceae bacterium]|nr:CinA family protein [Streptosporangiaceae bacterium]
MTVRQEITGQLAAEAIKLLSEAGQTVAVAESLTGGLVAAALTSVPGASVVVRGGVVAYATELKTALLGVPAGLLSRHGAVHPDVAAAMASGVRRRLGATYGAATTGVAGPGPAEGKPQGTVFVAVDGPAGTAGDGLELAGDRSQVREETVLAVLSLLVSALREDDS